MLSNINLPFELQRLLENLIAVPNNLRAATSKYLSESSNVNVHGEQSMQLDLFANDLVNATTPAFDAA